MISNYQAVMAAPFGMLGVVMDGSAVVAIDFLPTDMSALSSTDPAVVRFCGQLQAYLHDPRAGVQAPIAVSGTPFQREVWQAISRIPVGSTLTYSELAECVGSGARAVANACGANPVPLVIPCHRVVARQGLGGFMGGRNSGALAIKQWLLQHERRNPAAAG